MERSTQSTSAAASVWSMPKSAGELSRLRDTRDHPWEYLHGCGRGSQQCHPHSRGWRQSRQVYCASRNSRGTLAPNQPLPLRTANTQSRTHRLQIARRVPVEFEVRRLLGCSGPKDDIGLIPDFEIPLRNFIDTVRSTRCSAKVRIS